MARDIPGLEKKREGEKETRATPTRTSKIVEVIISVDEYSPGGSAAIRRNDRDAIEFDYGRGPCNFVCQNNGLRLASLKTGSWSYLL